MALGGVDSKRTDCMVGGTEGSSTTSIGTATVEVTKAGEVVLSILMLAYGDTVWFGCKVIAGYYGLLANWRFRTPLTPDDMGVGITSRGLLAARGVARLVVTLDEEGSALPSLA